MPTLFDPFSSMPMDDGWQLDGWVGGQSFAVISWLDVDGSREAVVRHEESTILLLLEIKTRPTVCC